jgi:hypothetical protein
MESVPEIIVEIELGPPHDVCYTSCGAITDASRFLRPDFKPAPGGPRGALSEYGTQPVAIYTSGVSGAPRVAEGLGNGRIPR